ncbi:hypothetical protein ACOCEA_08490 [Maribacter sp. CXY002]|uniref:hypothetical protein n=1 Tax=Maribacter luteocoastalis TaxID=3407671 RepID=UPI003B67EAB0
MPKYLVRFTSKEYYPNFEDLSKYKIKLGTFHHYRKIEDGVRQDKEEGQRGLDLVIKKPCKKLLDGIERDEIIFGPYDESLLNENGEFKAETHILVHEHLYEFNSWMFCCSIIEDLSLIPKLEEYFECDSHYFISDLDGFVKATQNALADSLKKNRFDKDGKPFILHGTEPNVWIDGFKNYVKYGIRDGYQNETVNTLTEFMNSQKSRAINMDIWFHKPKRFEFESEFRIVLYATAGREENKVFNINDDSRLVECDLTDCISIEPKTFEK